MVRGEQGLDYPADDVRRRRAARALVGVVSPMLILGILLAISLAGNGILSKLYVGAKEDTARVQQAYDSFVAQAKVLGDEAEKKATATKTADEKRKKDADTENATAVANRDAVIARLRKSAKSSGGGSVSPAPSGSKCPDGQTCFDRAEYQRTIGDFDTEARRLADEGSAVTTDMNTALKWAKSLSVR